MFDKKSNKDFLFGNIANGNSNGESAKNIVRRSSKAVCGIQEREVVVPSNKVSSAIRKLKNAGFVIIGTSFGDTKSKKIWFLPAGGF